MLESIQKIRSKYIVVVTGDGEKNKFNLNDYFSYYIHFKNKFIQAHQSFSLASIPDPADSNSFVDWSRIVEKDHLSQIANITKNQIKKINKQKIFTTQGLIDSDIEHIKGIGNDVLKRLKRQAKIQKESLGKDRPLYDIISSEPGKKIGLALLPAASKKDVYFDIEKGGLEYLWGAAYFDENGERKFKDFWAHNHEQEKIAFRSFIEWVFALWQQDPTMHIYHYSQYEITACRKLMSQYGICEVEVDQLLRNEVFVDLYKIVKGSLFLGEPRYSIKNVEHLYRDKRDTVVGSGGDSIVVYEHWREAPDGDSWEASKILNNIREYNI